MRPSRPVLFVSMLLLGLTAPWNAVDADLNPEDLKNAVPSDPVRPEGPPGLEPLAPEGQAVSIDMETGVMTRYPLRHGGQEIGEMGTRPGLPQPEAVLARLAGVLGTANFDRYEDTYNPYIYPYTTHVKVFSWYDEDPDHIHVCSGTLIDAYFVLTAGHCAMTHEEDWGQADSMIVVPSYDGSDDFPWGYAVVKEKIMWDGWIEWGDYDHDVALLRLDRPVGALTGTRGFGYSTSCDHFISGEWTNNAYPSNDGYDGEWMQSTQGKYDNCETAFGSWYGYEVWFDRPMPKGSSGSGAVKDGLVWAVRSNGYGIWDVDTYDTRLTQNKFEAIGDIIDQWTWPTGRLLPLAVHFPDALVEPGDALSDGDVLIYNHSPATYSGGVRVEVYLSPDDEITTDDTLIGSYEGVRSFGPYDRQEIYLPGYTIPASTEDGHYKIGAIVTRLDPTPAGFQATHPSDCDNLTVGCIEPVTAIVRTSPASATDCLTEPVTLQWQPQAFADDYYVQIGSQCGIGLVLHTTVPYLEVSGLTPGQWYYWRVRASGHCGNGPIEVPYNNSCWSFYIQGNTQPVPTLRHPSDGATCVDHETAYLDWDSESGVSYWHIQIGTSCGSGNIFATDGGQSAYDPQGLLDDTTYYWRVRAVDGCGTSGDWSECQSFTTWESTAGLYISLVSPEDDSECVPADVLSLDWAPYPGATEYTVWLGTSGCTGGPDSVWTTTATSASLVDLPQNTAYWWKVFTDYNCGAALQSPCWKFETEGPAPGPPDGLEPGTDITCSSPDPLLQWAAAPGASAYELEYTPAGGVPTTVTTRNTFKALSGLPVGTSTWRVRSTNSCSSYGTWSRLASFDVDVLLPRKPTDLASPTHVAGQWSNLNRITLTWTEAQDNCGMGRYSILVDQNPTTLPNTLPETAALTWETEPLADGSNTYVHVRSIDQAGNAGDDAAHLGPFWIDSLAPTVRVDAPNGGEIWTPESRQTIRWRSSDAAAGIEKFFLFYTTTAPLNWTLIDSVNAGTEEYEWRLPLLTSNSAVVRVAARDLAGNLAWDQSDGTFHIGTVGGVGDDAAGGGPIMRPAVPNPFASVTTIAFRAESDGTARLTILDAQGRLVRRLYEGWLRTGDRQEVRWEGRDDAGRLVGSGIYYCRLECVGSTQVQRVLFLRRL